MIKKLSVKQYRKLKELEVCFTSGINAISGTNGTCKTSILHMVSNSFQVVNRNCNWLTDKNCLEIIKRVNSILNPKIESLTRGDKQYNDPAIGQKGILFSAEYFDKGILDFRRHNSSKSNRYSVKPYYTKGSSESLPHCPVIYLGLSRLLPYGEFHNDDVVECIKKNLPENYLNDVAEIYKQFTGMTISNTSSQKMGDIKVRADFNSDQDGIDSNTISAGEDNLFILITAIVSLKYYYNCINSSNTVESVLLIDELDATLHPALQFKLLKLFNEYSRNYKIQVIFTTHSLTLLEDSLDKKFNVIYLIDNITSIIKMDEPDIYKIKMYLHSITKDDIYINKAIPIFTEDNEARVFLRIIFDYYENVYNGEFSKVRNLLHLVESNIGSANLLTIFNDDKLLKSTMRSICILDGDQQCKRDYSKCVLVLPGDDSPEEFIMKYSKKLYDDNDPFWIDNTILQLNYGKIYYRDNVLQDIEGIKIKIEGLKADGKTTKGVKREENKRVFNKHKRFFEMIFKHWVYSDKNKQVLEAFYTDLQIIFKKVSLFHGINPNEWKSLN